MKLIHGGRQRQWGEGGVSVGGVEKKGPNIPAGLFSFFFLLRSRTTAPRQTMVFLPFKFYIPGKVKMSIKDLEGDKSLF